MTIQETIKKDLRDAMISKNENLKSLLKVVIGEFDRINKVLTDDQATTVIKKMLQNAIDQKNQNEIDILKNYLPQQLTTDELKKIIGDYIQENNSTLKDIGKIMAELKAKYSGRYDGKVANEIIKEGLAALNAI